MALFLLEDIPGIDAVKASQIALVHDLAEAEVGDITPFDGISVQDKHNRERKAIARASDMLRQCTNAQVSTKLLQLYDEYEQGQSKEARYVKDIDKIDMLLQADEYERLHAMDLSTFFESTRGKMKTEFGRRIVAALEKDRNARKSKEMVLNRTNILTRNVLLLTAAVAMVGVSVWRR